MERGFQSIQKPFKDTFTRWKCMLQHRSPLTKLTQGKTDIFLPTFKRLILNILDLEELGMMKIIRTVQALFQILA